MPVTSKEWDCLISQWKDWQTAPCARLRYSTSRLNIARHVGDPPLRVLDVGGGNGVDAIYYAEQGHSVTLVDASEAMLAEARKGAQEHGVPERLTIRQADADAVGGVFGEQRFDLILGHMMIEFVNDAQGLLREMCNLLAPGGLLSLVDTNRYSDPYVKAFPPGGGNLADALKAVGTREYFHPWVNRLTPRFSADEFIDQLQPNGCALAGHYGIACLCYYLPNERKSDPRYFAELEQLEYRLTDTYPYYLLARFFQIVARRE